MNTPHAEWSEQEKEAQRGRMRRWRAAHPDKVQESNERAQAKRTEQYRTDAVYRERVKAASRLTAPSVQRERRARLKAQVFDHYGRVCACCGETEPLFLTLGHTKGDGAAHRNAVNGGKRGSSRAGGMTAAVYNDIIKRGFPNDLRIECYNCNCGSYRNGGVCPHAKMKQDAIA